MDREKTNELPKITPLKPKGLVQFFRESPLVGVALDLERDKDPGREVPSFVKTTEAAKPKRRQKR
jgi:hypothetical protein